jgi:hypothetical protein
MPRPKKDSIERTLISSRVDKKLFRKIRQFAFDDDVGTYEIIEQALREYAARREVEKKRKE